MHKEKIKITPIIIISWLLVLLCMVVICWLSSRTATESSAQSGVILQYLVSIFGDNGFTDFIVRKLAHCIEFTALSFLLANSFYQSYKKLMPYKAIIVTSIYAATDEIHQKFVDGRSCELRDWAIDTAGAIIGAVVFIIIIKIFIIIRRKKQNSIDTKNN